MAWSRSRVQARGRRPLAGGKGRTPIPEQLVLGLAGSARVPALTTIDDAVGPVSAVAGDALRLARDEVTAARVVIQRAQNDHCEKNAGRLAPLHAVQVAGERGLIGAAADGSAIRLISNTAPIVIHDLRGPSVG